MSNAIAIHPINNWGPYGLGPPDQIFKDMRSIHDEIERAAFNLFQQRGTNRGSPLDDWLRAESDMVKPVPICIKEDKDHLTINAEVPGFSPNELKVQADGFELRICGRSDSTDNQCSTPIRRVCCTVKLPAAVKTEHALATLNNGLLTLRLPKAAPTNEIEAKAAA